MNLFNPAHSMSMSVSPSNPAGSESGGGAGVSPNNAPPVPAGNMTAGNSGAAMSIDLASLKNRYTEVRQRIAQAAQKAGRSPDQIVLIAVTKHAEPDQIREIVRLGHADLGENRVQQLVQRATMLDEWIARHRAMPGVQWQRPPQDDPFAPRGMGGATGGPAVMGQIVTPKPIPGQMAVSGLVPSNMTASGAPAPMAAASPVSQYPAMPPAIRWHMIGHLQRNKARKAVDLCRLIHSVDSLRLAEELQVIGLKREKPIECLLQVNCSAEEQKHGCAIPAAIHLAEQMESMVHLAPRGMMTMAAHDATPDQIRSTFARCRELFEEIRETGIVNPRFNILSMGMSGDYEMAIEEGSNMVRVGTALFGEPRPGVDDADLDED